MSLLGNCPDCGAKNSVVHDMERGCVLCEECGSVLRYGMAEDPNNKFEEETQYVGEIQAVESVGETAVNAATGRAEGAASGKKSTPLENYRRRVMKLLFALRERTAAPERVVESAAELAKRFSENSRHLHLKNDRPEVLAGGVFSLAAAKAGFPVQVHEILHHLEGDFVTNSIRPATIEDMKSRLVAHLGLQAEVAAASAVLLRDLTALYLERIQLVASPYPELVTTIAEQYSRTVSDFAISPSARVVVAIVLARTSVAISEAVTKTPPLRGEEAKQFFERILKVTFEKADSIAAALKHLKTSPHFVQQFINAFASRTGPVASSAQSVTAANGGGEAEAAAGASTDRKRSRTEEATPAS